MTVICDRHEAREWQRAVKENLHEAREWLGANKNTQALAGNRFRTTEVAKLYVELLYKVGAVRVEVGHVYDEPRRIEREGGPYADMLFVTLPADLAAREAVLDLIHSTSPDEQCVAGDVVELWWD